MRQLRRQAGTRPLVRQGEHPAPPLEPDHVLVQLGLALLHQGLGHLVKDPGIQLRGQPLAQLLPGESLPHGLALVKGGQHRHRAPLKGLEHVPREVEPLVPIHQPRRPLASQPLQGPGEGLRRQGRAAEQLRLGQPPVPRLPQQPRHLPAHVGPHQLRHHGGSPLAAARWGNGEHTPAGHRRPPAWKRPGSAKNEALPHQRGHGRGQTQLGQSRRARLQALLIQQGHRGFHLRGAQVQEQLAAAGQGGRHGGQQAQLHIQHPRLGHLPGAHQHHAALELPRLHPGEVHRRALAREHPLHGRAMHLEAPHAIGARPARQQRSALLLPQRPRQQRARHHRAKTLEGEDPVHRQERGALHRTRGQLPGRPGEAGPQLRQPLARPGGARHHGGSLQERPHGERHQIRLHQREPPLTKVRQQVRLGEGNDTGPHAQQAADVQVLARLGHDALVRGHHQHRQVHAPGARGHRLDEALVAGHIHHPRDGAALQRQVGKAQLQGDAAALLLFEPVCIDARQGFHQGRLAVVDVPRRPDDHPVNPRLRPCLVRVDVVASGGGARHRGLIVPGKDDHLGGRQRTEAGRIPSRP
ncbi:conserved hypothetical protein [Stigmatella aurantiaca DW4/3-1]|uniref:Uncharacterized protein n=1 Tax=Stigmatella aurantiaca (strain DW4/3-1) TaxID=378806 RepID=Q092S1_STIAD|nr:conserved hypothetical protein [Stigmatella aurantiaca DW4/3-1]